MTEPSVNNEELAAFVTSTLNGIASGVESASSSTSNFEVPSSVKFEVAVTATKETEMGGGLKLQVFNAAGKNLKQDETVSRVTFEVATSNKGSGQKINYPNRGIV